MSEEKMTITERLRNPQWIHGPELNSNAQLDKEQTLADMREAADVIEGHGVLNKALVAARRNDFRWLIEAPGPRYLAVRKITTMRDFTWTADHNLALYFHSQEQADLTMCAIKELEPKLFAFEATLGNARPIEHGWM